MNYGHRLEIGVLLATDASSSTAMMELARRAEDLGYDLVTVEERLDDPEGLDSWTLLSWIAGQTERIHLAATLQNASFRLPAVTAHAAASLDLLSGGRLGLAFGTADDGDAIDAMGGQRLTAQEELGALREALEITRSLWDLSTSRPLRYHGTFHRLEGASRGPIPAHEIPIWISGSDPWILELVGETADGWIGSIADGNRQALLQANQIIDRAAIEAGRDPREIRRLVNISGTFATERGSFLNGPVEQWVEDLVPLVVEAGVSTLILSANDPETIERFAREVVPALRQSVLRVLPEAFSGPRLRHAAVRAKRREGIDYDNLPASLARVAIEPGDVGYARVKSTYLRGGAPGLVLQVENTEQVIEALAFARRHPDLPLSIRSGGHGISGRSTNDGGIVIDVSRMNAIEVLDPGTRRVRVGPGARWQEVAAALHPYGLAITSGDYGGVGVGGLATAGGIGFLGRKHGLTIDHVRAVELVLADGSIVRASASENPDLFWAVRGAGANFGIVTSFEFEAGEVGNVGWAQFVFDASNAAAFLEQWGAAVEAAPRDLTSFLIMGPPRNGQPAIAQMMTMIDSDDPETIVSLLQPFAQIAPMYEQNVIIAPYASIIANAPDTMHGGIGEPVAHSGLLDHITPEFAAKAARMILTGATYFFEIRSVGGAIADVDPDATAYAHRSANFAVSAFGTSRQRLAPHWEALAEHFDGLYLSFETDRSVERIYDAFPPKTLERLRELKARYDPDNVFRDNFNIAPQLVAR